MGVLGAARSTQNGGEYRDGGDETACRWRRQGRRSPSSRPHSWPRHLKVEGLSSRQWRREPESQSGGKSGCSQLAVNRLINQGWIQFPNKNYCGLSWCLQKNNNNP